MTEAKTARERLESMTLPELRKVADDHEVQYVTRTKKADLVAAVEKALPSPRASARRVIIQAVNRFRLYKARAIGAPGGQVRTLGSRNIQQAVCIARRNRLVRPEVLETAGYRGVERR